MSAEKIVADEDTAYDEVIQDLKTLVDKHVTQTHIKKIFTLKLEQLQRLIEGEEQE